MSYTTPQIDAKEQVPKKTKLDLEMFEEIKSQLKSSENLEIKKLAKEIFETKEGKSIIDLFLKRRKMKRFKF